MNKNILNKNGTAFIGLLVSVFVIALVFVGSFYFYNGRDAGVEDFDSRQENVVDAYKNAQGDIADINEKIKSRNEEITEDKTVDDLVVGDIDLEKWHSLKRENEGFEMKYPQGWYYTVNHKEAKEKGYDIIIGFESDEKVWDQEPPYSIELVVSSKEVSKDNFTHMKELETELGKRFYLRTGKNNTEADYDLYVEEMVKSFKFVN